jgi:beta-aspartyl-peptidase (threonine type)
MDLAKDPCNNIKPVIIIHGGAWAIPEKLSEASKNGVKLAAKIGIRKLKNGASALDAVEAAIRSLEDDPGNQISE